MSKERSLKINLSWVLAGNIIFALTQWLVIVVLANLGTPKIVGQYTLALAITAPIVTFANLGFRNIQATDHKNQYKFEDYFSFRLVTSLFSFVIICIIVIGIHNMYPLITLVIILLIGISKSIEANSDIAYGQFQKQNSMDYIGISQIFKGLFSLLGITVAMYFFENIVLGLILLNILWFFRWINYDLKNTKKFANIKFNYNLINFKNMFILGLPVGISAMLVSLKSNIPKYFIEIELNTELLGFYSTIAYIMVAGNILITAVGQATISRLSKYFIEGNFRKYLLLLTNLIAITGVIGLIGVSVIFYIGEYLLDLIYGEEYGEYNVLFFHLMLATTAGFVSSMATNGITAMRKFKAQLPILIVVTISNILACYFLIPVFELSGAAFSLLIASTIQFSLTIIFIFYILIKKRG